MSRGLLNRRRFLASLGAGGLAYPFLRGLPSARAATDPPKYLILLFTPSGFVQHLFGAEATAPSSATAPVIVSPLKFRETLTPLEPLKDKVTVIEGLNLRAAASPSHEPGMGALWNGVKSDGATGNGPSIDQVIAKQLNAGRPFNSVELMVRSSADWTTREVKTRIIYSAANTYLDPIDDPVAARQALFPNASAASGPDKKAFIRKKVLSNLNSELTSAQSKLCNDDKRQLQAMQESWNSLDSQLDQAAMASQSCKVPDAAPAGYKSPSLDFPTSAKLQMDILAMALACDLTRVASLQFSTATSQVTHTWLGSNQTMTHHDISHMGPSSDWSLGGTDPYGVGAANSYSMLAQLSAIDKWYAQQVYYLANALNQYTVGGKSLLDQTVICWSSEISLGAAHNHNNAPFVLVGGGGGKLKTGQVVRYPMVFGPDMTTKDYVDRNHNDLLTTLGQVMGVNMSNFGDADLCKGPLTELLVS
ncbi:MAG: DUF1552 domain-containing protein [Polyangiaceae bacterium]